MIAELYLSIQITTKNDLSLNQINRNVKKNFVSTYKAETKEILTNLFKTKGKNDFCFDNHFSNIEFCCYIISWPELITTRKKKSLKEVGFQFNFKMIEEITKLQSITPLISHIRFSLNQTNAIFKFIRLFLLQQLLSTQFVIWFELSQRDMDKMYVICLY